MSTEEILLSGIIAAMLGVMLSGRLAPDWVALSTMLLLGITRLVDDDQLLSGFSSSVVITLLGLFIITNAIEDSGLAAWISPRLERLAGTSEPRLILVIMTTGTLLSLVMSNIAAGAVLLPVVVRISESSQIKASRLLMPLSFGTLVGGMATYFTTANIILSDILMQHGEAGLGMMDFLPTGGLIVLGALLYMHFIGRHQLPQRGTIRERLANEDLYDTYQLGERLWKLEVTPASDFVHKSLGMCHIGQEFGVTIVSVEQNRHFISPPRATTVLYPGTQLWVVGRSERVERLLEHGLVQVSTKSSIYRRNFAEIIIPPRSRAISKTLKELQFRNRYDLSVVALWREGRSYRTDVGDFQLQVGDALLAQGNADHLDPHDYMVLHHKQPESPRKMVSALLITAVVLIIAIFNLLPLPEVMLAGGLALVANRNLTMEQAYQAVEWRVLFLIAGLLPISIAMVNTGLAARLGSLLVDYIAGYGDLVTMMSLFLLAVLVTQVIGGQVTALVIGPIAISTALHMGANPQATAVAVAIGCSTAFLTPIAHPVNLLMMGPAGYTFSDFIKVGSGMLITTLVFLFLGLVVFW